MGNLKSYNYVKNKNSFTGLISKCNSNTRCPVIVILFSCFFQTGLNTASLIHVDALNVSNKMLRLHKYNVFHGKSGYYSYTVFLCKCSTILTLTTKCSSTLL